MNTSEEWVPCTQPELGDTLKWKEPLWAAPNKPRGKRDKIGEQEITAKLVGMEDLLEFIVIDIQKLSGGDAPINGRRNDRIRRKETSLQLGACHKRMA